MYKSVLLCLCLLAVLPAYAERVNETLVAESLKCSACELAVGKLEEAIKADPSKLQGLVQKTCSTLHIPDNYCQLVIQALESAESTSPEEVCQLVKLCTESAKLVPQSLKCSACELAIGKLEGAIKADPSKLQGLVQKACSTLYIPDNYCQLVVQALESAESTSPQEVCQLIKLCTSQAFEAALETARMAPENLKCSACELAVSKLEEAIKADPSKLQGLVQKTCSALHIPDNYCQLVVQALESAESTSPQEVCQLIKLCTSEAFEAALETARMAPANLKCSACELAIDKLEGAIKADPSKLQGLVQKACSALHVPDNYCQLVVQALESAESTSPQEVCQLIKLCTAGSNSLYIN